MLWPLIITIVVSAACGIAGNHFGQALVDLAGNDTLGHLVYASEAIKQVPARVMADPLGLAWTSVPEMWMLLFWIVPWLVLMVYITHGRPKNEREGEQHGSAKFAQQKQLMRFAHEDNPNPDNIILLSQHYGLAISRTEFNQELDRNTNVIVIGGSGSGKTRYFVKPNVLQLFGNYFITDPKGSLLPDVGNALVDAGYEVVTFDTNITTKSRIYNPFANIRTDLEILEFVDGFMSMTKDQQKTGGDQFWDDSTRLLLCALIGYLRDWAPAKDYNFGGLLVLLSMAEARENDENYKSPLDLAFEEIRTGYEPDAHHVAKSNFNALGREPATPDARQDGRKPSRHINNTTGKRPGEVRIKNGKLVRGLDPTEDFSLGMYQKFKTAAGKTLKSILISVNVKFSAIATQEVRDLLCGDDEIHLEKLADPNCKYAIFDTFKDTNQQTLGFLHGILVWQAINMCCKVADSGTGRLERPVQFMLDEFKSLNLPKSIADMISVVRSRNVGMCIILQSMEQLYQMYDEHCANGIVGCCDTLLYLGGGDNATNKMVSDTIGQETVNQTTINVSHNGGLMGSGSWSENHQTLGRALIDQAEVGRISRKQCIVMIKGTDSAVDDKYPLEHHRRFEYCDPGHRPVKERRPLVAHVTDAAGKVHSHLQLPWRYIPAKYKEPFDFKAYWDRLHPQPAEEDPHEAMMRRRRERDRRLSEERGRRQRDGSGGVSAAGTGGAVGQG